MQPDRLPDLEVLLGHVFRDKSYIINALSHSSIKSEARPSNERLEFLGDSVLGLIVSEVLYRRFPDDDEGTLTRIKSQAVSRAALQRVAVAMGLDRFIMVGKGVAKREIPGSLLGNLYEAIVGAIYLDAGLAATRKFILRHLDVVIDEILEDRAERNYKSMLQHHCQRDLGGVPTYHVLRESGPAHGRTFEVAILVNSKEYGRARAASKKEAEQGAARAALIHFGAVDEKATDAVRGAGTVLRVGPVRSRRRRGGRSEKAEEQKPAEKSSRRRRGGRSRKKEEASPERAAPTENPPGKKTARKKTARSRSRKKAKADARPEAEQAPAAPAKKKKKKKKPARRRSRGKRKDAESGAAPPS